MQRTGAVKMHDQNQNKELKWRDLLLTSRHNKWNEALKNEFAKKDTKIRSKEADEF